MFEKGKSGNPGGKPKDKVLTEELRRALYANDRAAVTKIVDRLVKLAIIGEQWAVAMVFDRMEGKPVQESHLLIEKHDSTDWSRDELVAFLNDARARSEGTAEEAGRGEQSDSVH